MTIWLDAQLPPRLAEWIKTELAIDALAVRDVGLRDASDKAIFAAAREANAILISKDRTAISWRWYCTMVRRPD